MHTQLLTPARTKVPDAESYADKVRMTDMDLEMPVTEEEKRELMGKKSSYVWKGLRLASKKQLSSFDRMEHGKGLEALQPANPSTEANDGAVPMIPDDRGAADPQADSEHSSVEEQRPDHGDGQVTADSAA